MTTTSTTLMSLTDRDRQAIYAKYGLTCVPRYATLRNFDNPTYGGKVAKIAAALGTPLMPWQRYTADVSLEIDPATGIFVYRKVGCTVPRQSGKTSLILPTACHRGMAWQKQRILYAAQSGTAAREKWEDDHVDALLASRLANRIRVRKANGREAIIWKATRSLHGITTNTEKAGHGKTLHQAFADEYFAQVDYRLDAAWSPAMITVVNAQRYWFSTAGTSKSIPLNAERERGRQIVESGEPTRTAYFDWSAPDGADYTDPAVWFGCMPALCPNPDRTGVCRCSATWRHTVTEQSVRAELESLELVEFLRAYMNWTREDDEVEADPNVPTLAAWELLSDEQAAGGEVLALAIDVNPKRDYASISAVGEGPDGLRRIVVLEHGPGTHWVVKRAVELQASMKPVAWALDDKSPAGTLIQPLERAGIKRQSKEPRRGELWIPSLAELTASCGQFADGVRQADVVHLGQPELAAAIVGARTRPIGDGAWAWGRKLGAPDITPLVSATLALAAYERFKHLGVDYDPVSNIW